MLEFLIEYGLFGLFLASFLAATILPFSSELILIAILSSQTYNWTEVLFIATLGNFLGGVLNYLLGRLAKVQWLEKWFKISVKDLQKHQPKIDKYGSLIAFLTWVPIIGDPLSIALGWFRVNYVPVFIYMFIGKFLRYYILTLPFI